MVLYILRWIRIGWKGFTHTFLAVLQENKLSFFSHQINTNDTQRWHSIKAEWAPNTKVLRPWFATPMGFSSGMWPKFSQELGSGSNPRPAEPAFVVFLRDPILPYVYQRYHNCLCSTRSAMDFAAAVNSTHSSRAQDNWSAPSAAGPLLSTVILVSVTYWRRAWTYC